MKMSNERIKYPRTFHLSYSLTISDDDKRHASDDIFKSMIECVMTEKRDGENTTVYHDGYLHARSIDGNHNAWQSKLKSEVWTWCSQIPEGWRVCGENLYAQHSIKYEFERASQLFQVFGIYDDQGMCLSWDDTVEWCKMLGLETVPLIWRGKYESEEQIVNIFNKYNAAQGSQEIEGFVLRNSAAFAYEDFKSNVGKYVRANHVTTDEHWTKNWKPNVVKEKS